MPTTLKTAAALSGHGLHRGLPARATLRPAPPGAGIAFRRMDERAGWPADGTARDPLVPARWDRVAPSSLNTTIANPDGVSVSTIEHLMAAFAGLGVHDALVEVDGPELPILDGSAAPWARAILLAGLQAAGPPPDAIEVLERVEVRAGDASAALEPARAPAMSFRIDFPDAAIGRQALSLPLAGGAFLRELADSRTFCRLADVDAMRARGLAQGGTYLNAVVVDGARVLSPGGLRHPDEPVRHKMLDALGDLWTAGAPILGRYRGVRAGHALTNALLRALFARPHAWRRVPVDARLAARLPGAGVTVADLAQAPAVA